MRALLFVFLFSVTLHLSAQSQPKNLGEFIYNVPLKKLINVPQLQTEWWDEYLEYPAFENLFKRLLEKIDSGKIQVMLPAYPFKKIASPAEVKNILNITDTVFEIDPATGQEIMVSHIQTFYFEQITSITFVEDWSFDETDMSFTKKVKGFVLNKEDPEMTQKGLKGEKPVFYVPIDRSYNANVQSEKNISDNRNVSFLTYDLHYGNTFRDSTALTSERSAIRQTLAGVVSASKKNKKVISDAVFPYTSRPEKKHLSELISKINAANDFKFYEEWDFDVNKLTFEKKVKGIILQEEKINNDSISKKKIAFVALNGFVPSDAFNKTQINIDKISSDVVFGNFSILPYWMQFNKLTNCDSAKIMGLSISIANEARTHKLKTYPLNTGAIYDDPWDPTIHQPKTDKETDRIFVYYDTSNYVEGQNGILDTAILRKNLNYDLMSGFRFFESWSFDLSSLHFEKKIKTMGPLFPDADSNTGDTKFIITKFDIDPPITTSSISIPPNLIAKNITYTVPIDKDIREANAEFEVDGQIGIIWNQSWKENLYQYEYYPLIEGLLDGVFSGKIEAVNPADHRPLKKQEVKLKLESMKDSSFVQARDISTDYTLVNRIQFIEDWYFDQATGALYKKVNAITLLHANKQPRPQYSDIEWKENPIFTIILN